MTGLFHKFRVERVDGRDRPGGDKEGAFYFVLDVANDPYARTALVAYAEACKYDENELAQDLLGLVEKYDG